MSTRQRPHMHAAIVLLILILTYIGMAAGRIAWLQVDRTGIALLAVIALLASGEMTLDDFGSAVDMPTLALLFAMMIISAQLAESGFIDLCAHTMVEMRGGTTALLALTVAIGGGLSAVLANDILIITMALAKLLAGAQRRGARSAAVCHRARRGHQCRLVGHDDRQSAEHPPGRHRPARFLGFSGGLRRAGIVRALGCFWRGVAASGAAGFSTPRCRPTRSRSRRSPSTSSTAIRRSRAASRSLALLILFATPLPGEIGALIIAVLLLANRKITSRTMIAAVDWPLLLLVSCLFAITGQLNDAGIAAKALTFLDDHQLLPNNLIVLLPFAGVTSNAIGSVPTAMLLLQIWPAPPSGVLYALALAFYPRRQLSAERQPDQPADRRGAPNGWAPGSPSASTPAPAFR